MSAWLGVVGGRPYGCLCLFCVGLWLVRVCEWGKRFFIALWAPAYQNAGSVPKMPCHQSVPLVASEDHILLVLPSVD